MPTPSPSTGETVRWSGRISHWHYLGRWLLVLLLLAAAIGTFFFEPVEQFEMVWMVRGVLLVAAVAIFLWIHLDRIQRRYTITDHRVIVEFGLVSRQSNEIRLHDVRSINLTRTGFLGLLGVGRVEFSSAATDDADVIFWNVAGAEKVRDIVRSVQSREPV